MFVRFEPWVRGAIKIGRESFAPRPVGQVATPCPEDGRRARSVWADRIRVVGGRGDSQEAHVCSWPPKSRTPPLAAKAEGATSRGFCGAPKRWPWDTGAGRSPRPAQAKAAAAEATMAA